MRDRLALDNTWGWPLPVAIGLAILAGLIAAAIGWLPAVGLAVALPLLAGLLVDPRVGLLAAVGLIALLPYAVLPLGLIIAPSLITLVALATLSVWALRLLLDRRQRLATTPLDRPGLVLLAASLFAFVTGLNRGYTTQTYHDYAKLIVGLLLSLVAINTLRAGGAAWLVSMIIATSSAAATVGLALYAAGPAATEALLLRLVPLGYPTVRVVRWIEDDPTKSMRLTATSVDPNSFGGLLMIALVLAVAQAVALRRLVPRWLTLPAIPLLGLALLLTQSRGAWVGAAAGIAWLALIRYRRLAPLLAAAGLVVVGIGLGGGFIDRLLAGLRLEDPATRLRLAEYQNAFEIMRQYPLFGVGFGQAPSIDLQTGVSSIYLTIGTRMGLIGLVCFLWAVSAVGVHLWRVAGRHWQSASGELLLTLLAGLVTALTAGLLDHYFWNIEFSHMATLFWLLIGAGLGTAELDRPNRPGYT